MLSRIITLAAAAVLTIGVSAGPAMASHTPVGGGPVISIIDSTLTEAGITVGEDSICWNVTLGPAHEASCLYPPVE